MVNLVNGRVITVAAANVVLVAGTKSAASNTDISIGANCKTWIAFEHLGTHASNVHPLGAEKFAIVVWVRPFKFDAANRNARKNVAVPVRKDATTFHVERVDRVSRFGESRESV